jgi:type VI secretion system secreted protein VgrG
MNIFNKDGFIWWIGVVEDRFDPEKAGRVRVRIYGYHTEDKTLLPTKDLPWAIPILPITSASLSGIGFSPLGPIEGSWVLGFFLDGADMQQPAIFGTLSTKTAPTTFTQNKEPELFKNRNDGILKDSKGQPVLDVNNNPIRTGVPTVEGWEIGQTSEKYESEGRGPGTINNYNNSGDLGGASYGTYQFASFLPSTLPDGKSRPNSKTSPLKDYLASSKFKDKFVGLDPATSAFDNMWKSIASQSPKEFEKDQHDYVQEKFYNVMISNLKRKNLDLTNFGPAVQDLVWSTSVQLGPNNTKVFTVPLEGKSQLTDRDIVELVGNYKINSVDEFFKSSSNSIRAGVKTRWTSEKADLLKLIKA